MTRQLYELVGEDPARRFSPYCWRIRMALAHKGLEAELVPWRFTEGERLAFAGSVRVPVLVDGDTVVHDSTPIAEYLDRTYHGAPALFRGDTAARRFIVAWTDMVLQPTLVRVVVPDIPAVLDEPARSYFVASREARFGMTLGQLAAGREAHLSQFSALLAPLRHVMAAHPFLGGASPDYADYTAFGAFQMARCVSPTRLLENDDPVHAWRERMLDLFGGLARNVPAFD